MAMTTAADLIRGALKELRAIGQGETPTAEEMSDGLDRLNMMLESWSLDRLYVYTEAQDAIPLVVGKNAYTWGTGGDIPSSRPVRLIDAYTRDAASIDHTARILVTANDYDRISVKGLKAYWPTAVWLETTFPLSILHVWPTPDKTYNIYVRSYLQLQQFANLNDAISLPPGYKEAIMFNLAPTLAGSFGIEPSPAVLTKAVNSASRLKRNNIKPGVSQMEPAGMNPLKRTFNINSGE